MHDEEEGIVPQCPAIRPVCNEATHECEPAQSGSILLNRIVITSSGCTDCTTEGADMTLTGRQPDIQCQTVDLDHPGIPDYVSRGDFDADKEGPHENGWGSCHKSALEGKVTAAVVTWRGEGTWTPDNLCFDWDNTSYEVSICAGDGSTLASGETMTLTCTQSTQTSCP